MPFQRLRLLSCCLDSALQAPLGKLMKTASWFRKHLCIPPTRRSSNGCLKAIRSTAGHRRISSLTQLSDRGRQPLFLMVSGCIQRASGAERCPPSGCKRRFSLENRKYSRCKCCLELERTFKCGIKTKKIAYRRFSLSCGHPCRTTISQALRMYPCHC